MKVFDSVPVKKPAKNVFNLSHDVKSSYNFDKIYPFLCRSIYPGDTFNCRAEVFLRAMPLKAPVMHNVDMRLYFFFVPNRLLWNENKKRDWKVFITGGEDGKASSTDPNAEVYVPFPTWNYAALAQNTADEYTRHGSLIDHMGFPTIEPNQVVTGNANTLISALPFRAYQLVWNEYFRNQNVQNEVEFSTDCGAISQDDYRTLFEFRRKCWEKDYFTSCLPFQQRGEAVTLPIEYAASSEASIYNAPVVVNAAKVGTSQTSYGLLSDGTNGDIYSNYTGANAAATKLVGTAQVDANQLSFTGLSVGTINDFRYCLRLQQWLENNARCGSRYIEQLFSHFGVRSSDARLQRPELLGGGKIPLLFTDVEQTSFGSNDSGSDDVLGDLGGKGTLYGKTSGFKKYFEEHGILLGVLTIIPRTSYMQGIPREFTQFDKTDWYFPEFANLGEQAVLNKELYFNPAVLPNLTTNNPDGVFGYQGRFTELRYIPSSIHGEMRNYTSGLAYWHFGRHFTSMPALNANFVEAHSQVNSFALTDITEDGYDPFVAQIHLDIKAVRPMPKYAVPTL